MEFNQTVMARRSLRAYEEGKTVEKVPDRQILCCNVTGNAGKSKKRLPSGI